MKPLNVVATLLTISTGCVTVWGDPVFLFGFTNSHQVVSLVTNQGTFLTSTNPFNGRLNNNSGWWSVTEPNYNKVFADNYIVGTAAQDVLNNFFTFSIPVGIGIITSASISAPRGGDGGQPSTAGVPFYYLLFDVSTPAVNLTSFIGTSAAIFNDLGSGVSYGSILVTDLTDPDPLVIPLDAAAIAAINSSKGSVFSIGGTLSPVPEPGSAVLVGSALLALRLARRKRH